MKERKGYDWVETNTGGFWIKQTGTKHSHKLPMFCPYEKCEKKITGTIDDPYLLKYGICRLCFTMFVEDRITPLIDVEEYSKRLRERNY